jgi:hypothetical protein
MVLNRTKAAMNRFIEVSKLFNINPNTEIEKKLVVSIYLTR